MPFEPDPDFQRVRTALVCRQPDRVPLMELYMDTEVKEAFLGRPMQGYEDEVEFWYRAGYDYVCVRSAHKLDSKGVDKPSDHDDAEDQAGQQSRRRSWAPEHKGQITTWEEFEKYPWPDPDAPSYEHFDHIRRLLPPGMKMIGRSGDIFTHTWMFMGFEHFCFSLVEQPDLVAAMMEKIAHIIFRTFQVMAEIDGVGALWYTDDIAYTESLMVSPAFYRQHLFPWMKRSATCAPPTTCHTSTTATACSTK